MEFSDLNDDIEVDDWLVPSEEISRRRLIKQTFRHNIYKADWFGDVLIYEPKKKAKEGESRHLASRRLTLTSPYESCQSLDQEELRSRLNELDLNLNINHSWSITDNRSINRGADSPTDSAYSSTSSTPQYHTKNLRSEFEFPQNKTKLSPSSSISSLTSSLIDLNNTVCEDFYSPVYEGTPTYTSEKQVKSSGAAAATTTTVRSPQPTVILNKDSYKFNSMPFKQSPSSEQEADRSESGDSEQQSTWFELNELRLIAHESFILFMGASIEAATKSQQETTSLVMQMNHPKAVSLFNLLHATRCTATPLDRFFTTREQHLHHQLDIKAKLNICQQVTNAMTYLHDKNIVHGRLTSINIYLEPNQRVKISLIDNDENSITLSAGGNKESVEFNLPSLTYLSPELVKTITVTKNSCDNNAQVQIDTSQLSKKSDIYSFGTLLYELFEEKFPFAKAREATTTREPFSPPLWIGSPGVFSTLDSPFESSLPKKWNGNIKLSAQELIFQIGNGQIGSLTRSKQENGGKYPALVEHIISACWSANQNSRPKFKQLAFF